MPDVTDRPAVQTSDGPVLRVRGLAKSYAHTSVVSDISFDISAGEVLTLLGPSGCGKSTTLRMIAGLDQPDGGDIWIRGRLVASPKNNVMVLPEARRIGLVFQSYAIWPHMTVADNIAYPLRMRGIDRSTLATKVADIIAQVKLDGLATRMPSELSGGQQQRVALARALIYEPDLLLLDEPLSNLDSVLRKEMRSQIKMLQSRLRTTVLYVTHDQEEAMALSNRVIVMNHGRIEQTGSPSEIYEQPATRFVRDFVGEAIRLRGTITESGSGRFRIQVGACLIESNDSNRVDLPPGGTVEVSFRPEDVRLQTYSAPADGGLVGSVVETTYFGDRLECAIRIDGVEEPLMIKIERRQRLQPAERVVLHVDPACLRIWPL